MPPFGARLAMSALTAAAARAFPVLYFPAGCFLGLRRGRYGKTESAVFALVLGAVFYFSAPGLSGIIAVSAAAAGLAAGKYACSAENYFKTFVFSFFTAAAFFMISFPSIS